MIDISVTCWACKFYELVEPLINNANYQFNNIIISKNPGLKLSHSKWASELVYLSSNDSIISTAVKSLTHITNQLQK